MRALVLLSTLLATVPLTFVAPYVGVLIWSWLSFMAPQQLIYMPGLPLVYVTAVITAVGLVTSRESKRLPGNLTPYLLLLFMGWVTLSSFFALDPDKSWGAWNRDIKTFVLALTIMIVITNRVRVQALVWVIAVSIGYYSLKGGIFTIATGGRAHVYGVLGDNNMLGLMMVMSWPLLYYLRLHTEDKWVRLALLVMMAATIIAVLGTYSRGAFLAMAVVVIYFWWKAKRKVLIGVFGAIAIVPAVLFMPQQWADRMNTIDTYQEDGSAMGRIHQWGFAVMLAKDRPLVGGGFDASQSVLVVHKYYPDESLLAYHSIWFQTLGDHGFPGLVIFISLGLMGWRNASVVRRRARSDPDLAWARDLATMCQVSFAGYFIAGSFLSMAYYDVYYALIALMAVLREVVVKQSVSAVPVSAREPLVMPAPLTSGYAVMANRISEEGR